MNERLRYGGGVTITTDREKQRDVRVGGVVSCFSILFLLHFNPSTSLESVIPKDSV